MKGRPPLILGYHGIGELESRIDPIELYVPARVLFSQVRKLQGRGYRFVTMSEFADLQREGGEPPVGVAALTFDDGTVDHATVLPGILEDLEVPGTVFVCPDLAGMPYPWTSAESGIRFMSIADLVELGAHPLVEIGAHTNGHQELHEADEEMALREMVACRERLANLLGIEVVSFCYPRCHYSAAAARSAPLAGYKSAVTCGLRGSWQPYELKREVMISTDGPLAAKIKMRGSFSGLGSSLAAQFVRRGALGVDALLRIVPTRAAMTDPA